jgi:hypothetical protein
VAGKFQKDKKKNLNGVWGERKVPEQKLRSGLRKGKKIKANYLG